MNESVDLPLEFSGGDPGAWAPLILGKKRKKSQKEEKPAGQAKRPPPLTLRSGSATGVQPLSGARNNDDIPTMHIEYFTKNEPVLTNLEV